MTLPLYRRGGVRENLTDVISFYEDVTQQMKNAYDDLYQKLIIIGEKLNTTVQTLEKTNTEKENLLQQNEYLINEMEKEPINLGSTHILHNILCNKAEAYKILKEHEHRQTEKSNYNGSAPENNDKGNGTNNEHDKNNENDKNNANIYDTNSTIKNDKVNDTDENAKYSDKKGDNKDQTETEKTTKHEIEVKHEYFKIEDLLNTWKHKFENPVVNVTLNMTPVPKVATKCKYLKNRNFKSWQDELVYYIHGESTSGMKTEKGEHKKLLQQKEKNDETVNEQKALDRKGSDSLNKELLKQKEQSNETVYTIGTLEQKESISLNNQSHIDECVECSNNIEIKEPLQSENKKNVNIYKERSTEEANEDVNFFLHTYPMDANNNTCSLEKYDELQFSDNSEDLENSEKRKNSTEICISKLSEENKMLNVILNQKKKVYAQVFEKHVRGSSYEVFQKLQSMEKIQSMHNVKLGNTPTDFESNTFQNLHEKEFNETDPPDSKNPHVSLIAPTTASSNVLSGIHTMVNNNEQNDTEKKNTYEACSEHFNAWTQNQEKQDVNIANEQIDAEHKLKYAVYSEHLYPWAQNQRKTYVDTTNEQKTESYVLPNAVEKGKFPVVHNVGINTNIQANVSTHVRDVKVNHEEEKTQEKHILSQNGTSNLSDNGSGVCSSSKIYESDATFFPNYNDVHKKINGFSTKKINKGSIVQLTPNFFSSHGLNRNSQNYNFTNFSNVPNIKIMKPFNYYAGMNPHTKPFESNESSHNKNLCTNHICNPGQCYKYNDSTTTMQNYYNDVPQEITNDGDTVFFGSASIHGPRNSHLRGSSETLKNSFTHNNCNGFAGRLHFLNRNTEKNAYYYKSPFGSNINSVYNANKILHGGGKHLLRDISTQVDVKNEKINQVMKKRNHIKVEKKKTSDHFQKTKMSRNKRKTRDKKSGKKKSRTKYNTNYSNNDSKYNNLTTSNTMYMEYSNSGTDDDDDDDDYSDEKGNDSNSDFDSDFTFSSFCKIVNSENIQSNNLSSNYIDMNFDKRLLPYYTEDDSVLPFHEDINDIPDVSGNKNKRTNKGSNKKKRKREHASDSGCKKRNVLRSFHSNSSYSSDGFVSLNSGIGTNAMSSEDETYHANSISSLKTDKDIEITSRTNISTYNQIAIRSTNTNTHIHDIRRKNPPSKKRLQNTRIPSNDISSISVCGSYSREEEIKKLISDQDKIVETLGENGNDNERSNEGNMKTKQVNKNDKEQDEKKTQKEKDTRKGVAHHEKIIIKTIKPLKSVKPVKETKIKQTIKGTKRIGTTGPSKTEDVEKIENTKEKKKTPITPPLENTANEITNIQHDNAVQNKELCNTTPKNTFCFTSNEASFRTSLETIVSTLVETRNDTSNTTNFENVRTDKYELRAKKKITYVMPSIKRKLRRDGARQIFDPFLYNTMWKINK